MPDFNILDWKRGRAKLADGTIIIFRVAIVDIKELPREPPFNPDFLIQIARGISAYPTEAVMNEAKDKPVFAKEDHLPEDGWSLIDIADKELAYEEIEYISKDKQRYIIRVEDEPILASKNAKYKTLAEEPLYMVRFVLKKSWRKA